MATNKAAKKNQLDTFVDGQYQRLDNKVKIAILVALLVVPALLFYFFVFDPKTKEQKRLNTQIASTKAEISKAQAAIKRWPEVQKELEEVKAKFEETVVKFPNTQEIPHLLRSISDLGRAVGLEFMSFAPGAERPQDFYAEIPINMVLRGPYHSVGAFLDRVSKLERIVTAETIKMGGAKSDGGDILLTSNCQLVTYRYTGIPKKPEQQGKGKGKKR